MGIGRVQCRLFAIAEELERLADAKGLSEAEVSDRQLVLMYVGDARLQLLRLERRLIVLQQEELGS